MASAEFVPEQTEIKTVVVRPEKIVLHLDRDEAEAIHSMTGRFLADGPQSSIYNALNNVLGSDAGWSTWHQPKYDIKQGLKDDPQPVQTLHLVEI